MSVVQYCLDCFVFWRRYTRKTLMPEACRTSNSVSRLRCIGKQEEKVAKVWLLSAGPYSIALEVSIFQRLLAALYIRAASGALVSFRGGVTARATGREIETAGQGRASSRPSYLSTLREIRLTEHCSITVKVFRCRGRGCEFEPPGLEITFSIDSV